MLKDRESWRCKRETTHYIQGSLNKIKSQFLKENNGGKSQGDDTFKELGEKWSSQNYTQQNHPSKVERKIRHSQIKIRECNILVNIKPLTKQNNINITPLLTVEIRYFRVCFCMAFWACNFFLLSIITNRN